MSSVTIEALERAAGIVRFATNGAYDEDAARLDALAKALVDLTSEGWWVKQTGEAGDADCADVVRLRLEKP